MIIEEWNIKLSLFFIYTTEGEKKEASNLVNEWEYDARHVAAADPDDTSPHSHPFTLKTSDTSGSF